MMKTTRPLWLISLWFAAGIGLARAFPAALMELGAGLALVWVVWGLAGRHPASSRWVVLGTAGIACCLAGAWWSALEVRTVNAPDRLRTFFPKGKITPDEVVELTGRLVTWPEPAPNRLYLELDSEDVKTSRENFPATGRVRLLLAFHQPEHMAAWAALNPLPGARLRIVAALNRRSNVQNPGGLELSEYLDVQGYDAIGSVKGSITQLQPGSGTSPAARLALLRLRAFQLLERDFEPRTAGLLMASMLGSRYFLDTRWAEGFRVSSTFHLLVISGSHLALLGWAVGALLAQITRRRLVVAAITLMLVWAYAFLVGADPPVLRAALALSVWQGARLFYRTPDPLNTLGCAVLALLLVQPSQLFNPGFQLTIVAVAALVAGAAPWLQKLESIGRWRPTRSTPYPPRGLRAVRRFAEALYWSPRAFADDMRVSPVTYRLEKTPLAGWLEACGPPPAWQARFPFLRHANLQAALRWVFVLLIASGMVQVAMLPLSAYYFNRVAPIGLLSNLGGEAMMGCLMLVTAIYFLACIFGGGAAALAAWPVAKMTTWFVAVSSWGGTLKGASWRIPHLEGKYLLVYALYSIIVAAIGLWIENWEPLAQVRSQKSEVRSFNSKLKTQNSKLVIVLLMLLMVTGSYVLNPPRRWRAPAPGWLRVTFIDVGQGDSALLEFPAGDTMLIDSGGRITFDRRGESRNTVDFQEDSRGIGERVVSRLLWARGIRELTAIVGTHGDADHVQAYGEIVRNFPVRQAYCGKVAATESTFHTWAATLEHEHIPLMPLTAGTRLTFGDVAVDVLSPSAAELQNFSSDNDTSLVLRVTYGQRTFLFTGDIEKAAERELVASGMSLGCDVLKAPHHGSHTSSTAEFLQAAHPEHVVFCAPRVSMYGHPHEDVVRRYRDLLPNIQMWQTGKDGAITFETDGRELRVGSYASGRHVP